MISGKIFHKIKKSSNFELFLFNLYSLCSVLYALYFNLVQKPLRNPPIRINPPISKERPGSAVVFAGIHVDVD